jgi:hypothetical protein
MTLSSLTFVVICSLSVAAQQQKQNTTHYTNFARPAETEVHSNITTLYAVDPAASSLCFADGKEGGAIEHGGVFNRCSHIEFDHYNAGQLSVGIQGGELGSIVDLGTAADLGKEYGYAERVGNGQGFASLTFRDGKLMIRKGARYTDLQDLVEGAQLLKETPHSVAAAVAKPGHTYLARIIDRHNPDFQILVKLLVLKAVPGESVTFRWELL